MSVDKHLGRELGVGRKKMLLGEVFCGRELLLRKKEWMEHVGKGLYLCQAAVSPLLMMTGRGSQQAANADCREWQLEGVVTIPEGREVQVGQMGI